MNYELSRQDIEILRPLVAARAEAAASPVNRERAALWRAVNDRKPIRPVVWINEVPWHEMNVDDELTLRCSGEWARQLEMNWRCELYQWRHFQADMIMSDYITCPLAITDTGFGITEQVDIERTDPQSGIVSRHFHVQIADWPDLEKIKMPVVSHDVAATEARYAVLEAAFGDLQPVRRVGVKNIWYTPWDYLIRWYGIEQAMMDMVDRPDFVHAAVERVAAAFRRALDQYEALNLLTLDCDNTRIGSGGYGYVSELPGPDFDPNHVRARNMWGCSNAQIFSDVSPEMHWEFALAHDIPWLERWGLNYYGCCEPLDGKAEILARIPRLRKVSVSPWVKIPRAIEQLGGRYVLSRKPSPAILAEDDWRLEQARAELRAFLEPAVAAGCAVEVILKDISTVRYEPRRLWEWAAMAMEEVEKLTQ